MCVSLKANSTISNYSTIYCFLSVFLALNFFALSTLNAQAPTIRFTNIKKQNGLPNNSINAIAKDDLGFMWLGTEDGLCRYDGVDKMKVYFKEPQEANKLQSSNISSLYNDSQGNLWIGTRLGGLTRLHRSTNTWTTFRHQPNKPNSISNDEVLAITEDTIGRIWIGTENGLNVFDPETENFTSFLIDLEDPTALQAKAILDVLVDQDGYVWISTWAGGLHLFLPNELDFAQSKFKHIMIDDRAASQNIWKIIQDREKRYWVGTHEGGFCLMQLPENKSLAIDQQDWQPTFHRYISDDSKPFTISSNLISDILQDRNGNIWVGTAIGLNYLEASTLPSKRFLLPTEEKPALKFHKYEASLENTNSLVDNVVHTLFEDDQELLWIGTIRGISQYNWQNHQFNIHQYDRSIGMNPTNNTSCVQSNGNIILGTISSGLLQYDFQSKSTKPLINKRELNQFLKNKPISYLYSPTDSEVYIGTSDGIIYVDLVTLKIKEYPIPKSIKDNIIELYIRCIYKGKQENLWVGTPLGLFVINMDTGDYTHLKHDPSTPTTISDNSINAILNDKEGYMWIATYKGLNRVYTKGVSYEDLNTLQFENFMAEDYDALPSNRVTALEEIKDKIFVGTTNGLYAYDKKLKHFVSYNADGFKFWIHSMEQTKEGNIWASTQEGIFYFNQQTKDFNAFGNKDGLAEVSFRHGSSYIDDDGFIYFGSSKGFVKLHPYKIKENKFPPPIYITDLKKMNFKGETFTHNNAQKEISLRYDDYHLAINFAALNYNRPEKNKFAYMLEGFEENWNYTTLNTPVNYTNLPAGEYAFKVKAANNDGYWNEEVATVTIIKKPAFWQTGFFYTLIFLGFATLLFLGFQFYSKYLYKHYHKIELYNQKLNKEIEERERMEKILQAKNTELMRSNNDLEQFAYIASHDLQAPLRTISSFSRLLERSLPDKMTLREQEFFHFITDSVGNMQALVDDLLTFSRVNSQKLKLQDLDPAKLVDNILLELDSTLKETKARVMFSNFPELINADKIKLKQLLQNLITNGIKFSKPGVIPTVTINCKEKKDYWQFEVKDNGIGISKEFNDKIFKLFQRLHTSSEYKGTGIGLTLCKKIVEQHDGEIIVDSILGEGSNFIFTISRSLN